MCVNTKTNAAVFDNGEVCATLISDQGHRADMGCFRPVCEENVGAFMANSDFEVVCR